MQSNRIIQVEEKVPPRLLVPPSIQHMFAMFGASVLVPFIFKMNPAIVLFMNGIGTLLFILITKGKAPAYLGSSFAFIAPATIVINNWGYQYALGGFVVVGACGCVLAFIIYKCGTDWINVVLPPAAMGPVVALIGLELAGSAASTGCIVGDSVTTGTVITFLVTLAVVPRLLLDYSDFDRDHLRLHRGCAHRCYRNPDHCGCAAHQLYLHSEFPDPEV